MFTAMGLADGILSVTLRDLALLIFGSLFLAFVVVLWTPAHGAECSRLLASYYGTESGNRTATGERFDGSGLTAAMPSRKHLGEHWRVSYAGRSVVVRINDVGPRADLHRGIDLSRASAEKLGLIHAGVATVCLERVG
jgi:rare lipoprotein A (peptidoglycan hydrolase)